MGQNFSSSSACRIQMPCHIQMPYHISRMPCHIIIPCCIIGTSFLVNLLTDNDIHILDQPALYIGTLYLCSVSAFCIGILHWHSAMAAFDNNAFHQQHPLRRHFTMAAFHSNAFHNTFCSSARSGRAAVEWSRQVTH